MKKNTEFLSHNTSNLIESVFADFRLACILLLYDTNISIDIYNKSGNLFYV